MKRLHLTSLLQEDGIHGLQFNCTDKCLVSWWTTSQKTFAFQKRFLIAIHQDVCVALCACYSLKSNNEKTNPVQFVFKCTTEIQVS